MWIHRTTEGIAIRDGDTWYYPTEKDWDRFMNRDDLFSRLRQEIGSMRAGHAPPPQSILAPIQGQEVWAAGVTYLRSRNARMEESKDAGGGNFYDKVYEAERPELFYKAPPYRVSGPGGYVRIRKDSSWDVPEPELTLFITSGGKIVGYTIGNDMSSRSIEGENPLYLPQAKCYNKSAALGPCVYVPGREIPADTEIRLQIMRAGETLYDEAAPISRMKRTHGELAAFLYRDCDFPRGCFLMTGTCLVPDHPFTLHRGDEITITIEPIGVLKNIVE